MTRYQAGFNPYMGAVSLPASDQIETAKSEYVANSIDKVTATHPFPRIFDLWSTALKLAAAEDLDPTPYVSEPRRKFHDNVGTLIANDIPLMALIATIAVRHGYRYESKTFEEAISILDEPSSQVGIANLYAHAGAIRMLEVFSQHSSAPGPALTRHFQKLIGQSADVGRVAAGLQS